MTVLLIVLALLFTAAAVSYFFWVNRQTQGLTKGSEDKSQIPKDEEYSHMIVHELRAPVVAIKDSASILLSDKLSEGEEKKMLNLIHDEANKLLRQISTILDAAKAADGKLSLKKTRGDIANLVREEMALFQPEAKRKNINIISDIEPGLPSFFFDNVRITEALNNILSNSLKYTNENGIIKVNVTKDGGNVVISVADNGIGIAAEKQNRLFSKFEELGGSMDKKKESLSSGLGLYITKWIVEAHGGTIKITSEEGKGTTTIFTLPLDTNEPAQEMP